MPVITVIARSNARVGKELELERAIRAVILPTHKEEGCLKYALHRAIGDPSAFTIIESWASKELLDRHLTSKHITELFLKLPALVAAPPEISLFEVLAEGDLSKGLL